MRSSFRSFFFHFLSPIHLCALCPLPSPPPPERTRNPSRFVSPFARSAFTVQCRASSPRVCTMRASELTRSRCVNNVLGVHATRSTTPRIAQNRRFPIDVWRFVNGTLGVASFPRTLDRFHRFSRRPRRRRRRWCGYPIRIN